MAPIHPNQNSAIPQEQPRDHLTAIDKRASLSTNQEVKPLLDGISDLTSSTMAALIPEKSTGIANNGTAPLFVQVEEDFFAEEEEEDTLNTVPDNHWKVLVVDDEEEIHTITKLALEDLVFDNRPIAFQKAYSGAQAKQIMGENPDICLVLLDVVMEEDHAGLSVVEYIREELDNYLVRIILRTGQPGMAPEPEVVVKYHINDYKSKAELTYEKLYTSVLTALRSYNDMISLQKANQSLAVEMQQHKQACELIEKKNVAFKKFIPAEFLDRLGRDGVEEVILGDSSNENVAVFFADIRDFTSLMEDMTYEENFRFLNGYLKFIGPIVTEHHGFIDKYIGDSIMALFASRKSNVVRNAIGAAIDMQSILHTYNGYRKKCSYRAISTGIGIHTGSVSLGTVGFEDRMDTTVVGDTVNLASRMEGLTKKYGLDIAIPESDLLKLKNPHDFDVRIVDTVRVVGRKNPVTICEIFNHQAQPRREAKLATMGRYRDGWEAYRQGHWTDAIRLFREVQEKVQEDRALAILVERCEKFQQRPPPEPWEGIIVLNRKK
ncbi:MAG: adenylate/guanylate cyclase domain-containing response regulator [Magnetococcales bacterium]|nr:adenylate/guanylate cyclase domain-containing response regulator [Magnetococcales bacterium]